MQKYANKTIKIKHHGCTKQEIQVSIFTIEYLYIYIYTDLVVVLIGISTAVMHVQYDRAEILINNSKKGIFFVLTNVGKLTELTKTTD